jgi:single-stranded DNA-binding protein
MDSLNMVCLTGTLERQPTVSFEGEGSQVCRFTLRLEEGGRDGTIYKTYIGCEVYGRLADQAGSLQPGDVVAVTGALKWRSYVDKSGEKRGAHAVFVRTLTPLLVAVAAGE